MQFIYDDGGRAAAGYKGSAGDCVTRAIAIATGKPYQEVYDALHVGIKESSTGRSRAAKRAARKGASPRNGVNRRVYQRYLESLGWRWVPTMKIGQGCKVHLVAEELPAGRIIARVSHHICAVIDGVIYDTHDPQREAHVIDRDVGQPLKPGQWRNSNGICSIQRRCVYGYFQKA